jgi:hypothetical protein
MLQRNTLLGLVMMMLLHIDAFGISGEDWKELSEDSRHAYVAGVTDAWNRIQILSDLADHRVVSYEASEVERLFGGMGRCVSARGLSYTNLTATVTQYLQSRPEQTVQDMAVVIYGALSEVYKTDPAQP